MEAVTYGRKKVRVAVKWDSLVCSLPNDLCGYGTKGVDECGCIGSTFNEVQ
jgi:hypothetical protein